MELNSQSTSRGQIGRALAATPKIEKIGDNLFYVRQSLWTALDMDGFSTPVSGEKIWAQFRHLYDD